MGLNLQYTAGQTPLDDDEKEGLLIKTITTRSELDEFEQQNIEKAILWTISRRRKPTDLLTEKFVRELHTRMYADTWRWAGQFRKTNKNIGVDKLQIGIQLRTLLDNAIFWIDNKTFGPDEIAIRFKHAIVSIHCFPNGNGRHSRLMADVIAAQIFKAPVFTWGAANLVQRSDTRTAYLHALRAADTGNYQPLLQFARS